MLTNIVLASRTGTECVIRDLALGLTRRGHTVVVYAPMLGELGNEVRARGIAVTNDLETVRERPDVIHGHHNIPTVEAIARFPDCPAVWVCHDFGAWWDTAPLFPEIRRYFAVDETCRERLVSIDGVPPELVSLLHNAVDLNRFPPRRNELPAKPRTALAFTKTAGQIPLLEKVCGQLGIVLNVMGGAVGRVSKHPEVHLVEHDIVFATARMAIEAAAAGAAVIVGDSRGFAGLLTSDNYDRLRSLNFGLRSLVNPMTEEGLATALSNYDPLDAARVSARLRSDADLTSTLQRLETVYAEIVEEQHRTGVQFTADTSRAFQRFLHAWLPKFGDTRFPWQRERAELLAHSQQLDQELNRCQQSIQKLMTERADMELRLKQSQEEIAHQQRSRILRLGRLLRRIPLLKHLP